MGMCTEVPGGKKDDTLYVAGFLTDVRNMRMPLSSSTRKALSLRESSFSGWSSAMASSKAALASVQASSGLFRISW